MTVPLPIARPPLLKRMALALLTRLQGVTAYRRVAGLLRPRTQIHEASPKEWEAVQAWLRPGTASDRLQANPNATNLVSMHRGRVAGCVQLVRNPPQRQPLSGRWLFALAVRTPYRGMGIGEALSRAVIRRAASEGAKELWLLVREDNRPALRLYRKLGFEVKPIPEIQAQLEEEQSRYGRRLLTMSRPL